jgi:hypothetical protein
MHYRSPLTWMVFVICIGASFILGRISSLETTQAHTSTARTPGAAAAGDAALFLPAIENAAASPTQPLFEATLAALVQENILHATQIAGWTSAISYLSTQVPAQDRVRTVDALVYQRAELSTQVAALYSALGSPVPTSWPSPTYGPSPFPTRTPYIPFPTQTPYIPFPTPTQMPSATP